MSRKCHSESMHFIQEEYFRKGSKGDPFQDQVYKTPSNQWHFLHIIFLLLQLTMFLQVVILGTAHQSLTVLHVEDLSSHTMRSKPPGKLSSMTPLPQIQLIARLGYLQSVNCTRTSSIDYADTIHKEFQKPAVTLFLFDSNLGRLGSFTS